VLACRLSACGAYQVQDGRPGLDHDLDGDGTWLDQKRVTDVEAVRQGQQGVLRHQRALGHSAVAEHAEVAMGRPGATLGVAESALCTLATVDSGFDEPTLPLVIDPRELVSVDETRDSCRGETDVCSADSCCSTALRMRTWG
jgi:hypothetical protein